LLFVFVDERDLRPLFFFAHTGPRAVKAVCRRYAGKPTPRRRVGRLVCAAKTRARKAERPPTYCRPSGQGLPANCGCPPLRVALPGEPLAQIAHGRHTTQGRSLVRTEARMSDFHVIIYASHLIRL